MINVPYEAVVTEAWYDCSCKILYYFFRNIYKSSNLLHSIDFSNNSHCLVKIIPPNLLWNKSFIKGNNVYIFNVIYFWNIDSISSDKCFEFSYVMKQTDETRCDETRTVLNNCITFTTHINIVLSGP